MVKRRRAHSGASIGGDREDPLVAFKFGLEIEGKHSGTFTSVSGIGSESEVVYREIKDSQTGEMIMEVNPGSLRWTPITLKRGVTGNKDIWDWRQMVIDGDIEGARTNCSIIAYNQANTEIARWNLVNAWPSSVIGPVMDEGGTTYMVEEIVLVHEGVERVD